MFRRWLIVTGLVALTVSVNAQHPNLCNAAVGVDAAVPRLSGHLAAAPARGTQLGRLGGGVRGRLLPGLYGVVVQMIQHRHPLLVGRLTEVAPRHLLLAARRMQQPVEPRMDIGGQRYQRRFFHPSRSSLRPFGAILDAGFWELPPREIVERGTFFDQLQDGLVRAGGARIYRSQIESLIANHLYDIHRAEDYEARIDLTMNLFECLAAWVLLGEIPPGERIIGRPQTRGYTMALEALGRHQQVFIAAFTQFIESFNAYEPRDSVGLCYNAQFGWIA
ncbi:MAG TPA: hypothetical protein PLV25_07230, partial [Opitutales bacterium]|nr:hypothetical protein [Opitutales bacterium]